MLTPEVEAQLKKDYRSFLDWRCREYEVGGTLSGDRITSLDHHWQIWRLLFSAGEEAHIVAYFRSLANDADAQNRFLIWLQTQDDFDYELSCYQLAQSEGFKEWSQLRRFREPAAAQFGVRCLLVDRDRSDAGVLRTLAARIERRQTDSSRIWPLNFTLRPPDHAASMMVEVRSSVLNLFGWKGLHFWLWYLFAGDFGLWTAYRMASLFRYRRVIHRTVTRHNFYLYIDTGAGSEVSGTSLALAIFLAVILAIPKAPGLPQATANRLDRLFRNIFGGVAGCAFTGDLRGGKLLPVEAVKEKLDALAGTDVQRAVIPYENLSDVSPPTSLLQSSSVIIRGFKTLRSALGSIVPMRKTWIFINLVPIALAFYGWRYSVHPPQRRPSLFGVTAAGTFHAVQELPRGTFIKNPDLVDIQLRSNGHRDLSLKVTARTSGVQDFDHSVERQCLSDSRGGEWLHELRTPVHNDHATFNFSRRNDGPTACNELVLTLMDGEEIAEQVVVPLRVRPGPIPPKDN